MTREEAKKLIKEYKDNTVYFDNTMSENEMYKMLRFNMAFGEAETMVIIASLKLEGAKFKKAAE